MRKLFAVLLFLTLGQLALAQSPQYTPNLNLELPPRGFTNWDTVLNSNFTIIDTAVGARLVLTGSYTVGHCLSIASATQVQDAGPCGGAGSSIFTSFQFGTNSAITGSSNYLQLTASALFSLTQSGSGTSESPYVDTLALASQSENCVIASPNGSAGVPACRALVEGDLPSSGVTSGSYTNASITVNAQGVITAASNGSSGGVTSVFGRSGAVTAQTGDYSYSQISGTPTLYYQTLEVGATAATQQPTLNFIDGSNMTITCVNNAGASRTDCTFASTGGGSGVSSITGDGTLITNSGLTGAVTLILGNAAADTLWGNPTGSSATPQYFTVTSPLNFTSSKLAISNATTGALGVMELAGDLGGSATSVSVLSVHGTTYPTGGSLTTNTVPVVTGASAVTYETVPNGALANSTIGISGTANQITSSTSSPALGGSTTLAIANPFTFPGKATHAASTTSAASLNIPSGSAPSSPASGDIWNLSGIIQFYDGTHTNSFTTIQSAPTSGHLAEFSGTAGLLIDGGAPPTFASLLGCGSTAGTIAYYNGSVWTCLSGNTSGTQFMQETSSGVPSWAVPSGSGNVSTSGSPAQYQTAIWVSGTTITGIGPGTSGYALVSGGASANPSYAQLTSAGLNITTTTCTNQVVTAISSGAVGTCSSVSNAMLSNSSVTVNGQSISLGSSGNIPFQVNGTNDTSLAGINHITSTVNAVGLTITPSNPGTDQIKFEITGTSYTGNAATATALASYTGYSIYGSGASSGSWITPTANAQCLMSAATSYATTTPSFQNCPSGFSNPMTTLGDMLVENSSPAAERLAGPTAQNVPYILTSTPSGGVAQLPAWSLPGVPGDAQTGTSYTIANTDREELVTTSNSSAIAISLPQAGSGNFTNNFNFSLANLNIGLVTITPTTSTINGGSTAIVPDNWWAYVYSPDNANYRAAILPSFVAFPSCTSGALGFTTSTGVFPCNTFSTLAPSASVAGTIIYYNGSSWVVLAGNTSGTQYLQETSSGVPSWTTPSGSGTVTSVAESFTGGLISVSGSPITSSGTLALTVAGTSGGIPYFSSSSAWASSAALTAKQVIIGGGAGAAPTSIDFPDVKTIPAANCNNATAGNGWSIGSGGTVTCRAGTNNQGGYIAITDTSTTFAQFAIPVPDDWDTSAYPYIRFQLAYPGTDGSSSHTIIPAFKVSCAKGDGSTTDDVTFATSHSSSTITLSSATANLFFSTSNVQMNSTDMSGCVAGSMMIVQIGRATDTATSAADFYSATITFPRLLTVQAN